MDGKKGKPDQNIYDNGMLCRLSPGQNPIDDVCNQEGGKESRRMLDQEEKSRQQELMVLALVEAEKNLSPLSPFQT